MDRELLAFDDYWREVMRINEGVHLMNALTFRATPAVIEKPKNVRPAISGLLTEADGDHRVGRFKC